MSGVGFLRDENVLTTETQPEMLVSQQRDAFDV